MGAVKLDRLQGAIAAYVMERSPCEPSLQLRSFSFDGVSRMVGHSTIRAANATESLFVTLPREAGSDVFLAVSDGPPRLVGGALAGLEEYSAENGHLGLGDTVPLDVQEIRDRGWSAFLLLRVMTLIDGFPDGETLGGQRSNFFLAVFLRPAELDLKRRKGLDALLDHFESTARDITIFDPIAPN